MMAKERIARREFLHDIASFVAVSSFGGGPWNLVETPTSQESDPGEELFYLINEYRQGAGLPEVERWPFLDRVANARTEDIVAHFSHHTPGGNNALVRILIKLGAPRSFAYGEILSKTNAASNISQFVMEKFLASCTHRAYILWEGASLMGIAGKQLPDGFYYSAAVFAGPTQATSSWSPCT